MELEVTRVFPTLIGRFRIPDADAMNQDLHALILKEEVKYASLGRSNIGGWHSRPDFLNRRDPAVSALTTWVTWVLRRMIDASAGADAFQGTLSVSAWATLCRAGAYHAPHSHPDSAWSGVYYVDPGTGKLLVLCGGCGNVRNWRILPACKRSPQTSACSRRSGQEA